MKKTLVAMAALAATASFAQSSSLSITGDLWAGVTMFTNSQSASASTQSPAIAGSNHKNTSFGNGPAASRLRFVGTEAMGGGQMAKFHLEMQPAMNGTANATNLFNRGAWAGIGGSQWGEVRFGRQGTVAMGLICGVDQGACLTGFNGGGILFNGTNGTGRWISGNPSRGLAGNSGMNPASTGVASAITSSPSSAAGAANAGVSATPGYDVTRVINALTYLTPNWGGFTGQLQYAASNQSNGQLNGQGNGAGLSLNYANGPFMVGVTSQTAQADSVRNASGSQVTLGSTFDFGFAKLGVIGQQGKATLGAGVNGFTKETGWAVTATAPFGNFAPYLRLGQHKVAGGTQVASLAGTSGGYGAYGIANGKDAKMLNLGLNYNLSKRTKLNLDYAQDGAGNSGFTSNRAAVAANNALNNTKPTILYVGVEHHF